MNKRMKEIQARLKAIRAEIEEEGADLDALETESRKLNEEYTRLETEERTAEQRRRLFDDIDRFGMESRRVPETNPEERTFAVGTPEYRAAWLANLQGRELTAEERTAVAASATIPTQTMNMIVAHMEGSPLLAEIDIMQIPGNVTIPMEDAVADASWVAIGTASTDSTANITPLSLGAYKLIKTVEIGADVMAMSISAFETWLVERLSQKLAKAVQAAVLNGTGSNQPTGLLKSGVIPTAQQTTFTKAGMKYSDVTAIMALLKSDYHATAIWTIPSSLFFKEVLGMVDSNGRPIVVLDPQEGGRYVLMGHKVVLDDDATDTIVFGAFKNYKYNWAKTPEVKADESVGFRTGSTCYRAMGLGDGGCADKSAFAVSTRATA